MPGYCAQTMRTNTKAFWPDVDVDIVESDWRARMLYVYIISLCAFALAIHSQLRIHQWASPQLNVVCCDSSHNIQQQLLPRTVRIPTQKQGSSVPPPLSRRSKDCSWRCNACEHTVYCKRLLVSCHTCMHISRRSLAVLLRQHCLVTYLVVQYQGHCLCTTRR